MHTQGWSEFSHSHYEHAPKTLNDLVDERIQNLKNDIWYIESQITEFEKVIKENKEKIENKTGYYIKEEIKLFNTRLEIAERKKKEKEKELILAKEKAKKGIVKLKKMKV